MPELANLIQRVSEVESELQGQLPEYGISFDRSRGEWDEVKDVQFGYELRGAPSLRELVAATSQVDQVITIAAGIAAYTHPELEILPGGLLSDLESLQRWLEGNSQEWDLEVEDIGLSSLHLKLKPKGEFIKKVAKGSSATVALLAGIAGFTGVTAETLVHTMTGGTATHSTVYANDRPMRVPPTREEDIIVRLPPGSEMTETIYLSGGKRIVLRIRAGSTELSHLP